MARSFNIDKYLFINQKEPSEWTKAETQHFLRCLTQLTDLTNDQVGRYLNQLGLQSPRGKAWGRQTVNHATRGMRFSRNQDERDLALHAVNNFLKRHNQNVPGVSIPSEALSVSDASITEVPSSLNQVTEEGEHSIEREERTERIREAGLEFERRLLHHSDFSPDQPAKHSDRTEARFDKIAAALKGSVADLNSLSDEEVVRSIEQMMLLPVQVKTVFLKQFVRGLRRGVIAL